MIESLQAPDHVLALHIFGKLTGAEMDGLTAEVEAKLARHPRIGIVADLTGLSGMTLEALAKDIRYSIAKIGDWKRFPREAVITDAPLLKLAMKAIDPLVPQVEVRCFEPGERQAAVAWAADLGAARH
jgi:hypothetical protein